MSSTARRLLGMSLICWKDLPLPRFVLNYYDFTLGESCDFLATFAQSGNFRGINRRVQ